MWLSSVMVPSLAGGFMQPAHPAAYVLGRNIDALFNRSYLFYGSPPDDMKMKMRD